MSTKNHFRYPGIYSFSTKQKDLFFGREADIEKMLTLIEVEEHVLLYSKSGIGKTSLINAGVAPQLRPGYVPVFVRFHAYNELDEAAPSPTQSLINTLTNRFSEELKESNALLDVLNAGENTLWLLFKKLQLSLGDEHTFVLFFDQFEELFSYPKEAVDEFKYQLYEATKVNLPNGIVSEISARRKEENSIYSREALTKLKKQIQIKPVYSIRTDRLALLDSLVDRLKGIRDHFIELKPLTVTNAASSITAPASVGGQFLSTSFSYAPDAIDKIINYLSTNGTKPIETTQLQIICEQIEKDSVIKAGLSLITATHIPDFKDVFRNFYQSALELVAEEQRESAGSLIEKGLIRSDQRISLDEEACKDIDGESSVDRETLDLLVDARLLRAEPNSFGRMSYELAHDSLIAPVREVAKEKEKHAKLLAERKKRQEELEQVRQRAELEKKEQQKTLKQLRKARILLSIAIAGFILAIIGGVFAINQKNRAEESQIRAIRHALKVKALAYKRRANKLTERHFKTEALWVAKAAYDTINKTDAELPGEVISALTHAFYSQSPIQTGRIQRKGEIRAMAMHPNRAIFATAEEDNKIYLWQVGDSVPNKVLKGHSRKVMALAFSPKGDFLLSGGMDGKAIMWNIHGDSLFSVSHQQGSILSLGFSFDNELFYTGSSANEIIKWTIRGKKEKVLGGNNHKVDIMAFSPVSNHFVSTAHDKIHLRRTNRNRVQRTINAHSGQITSIDYAPDGRYFVSAGEDHRVILWTSTGAKVREFEGHLKPVRTVKFSPDGKKILGGGDDKIIIEWDFNGKELRKYEGDIGQIICLDYLSNDQIITALNDNRLITWNQNMDAFEKFFFIKSGNQKRKKSQASYSVILPSPDGKVIFVARKNKTAYLMERGSKKIYNLVVSSGYIKSAAFSPNNDCIVAGTSTGKYFMWSLTGELMHFASTGSADLCAVAFSNNGKSFAIGAHDGYIHIFDSGNNAITKLTTAPNINYSVAFTPDDKKILVGGAGRIVNIITLDNFKDSYNGELNNSAKAAFSPTNKHFAVSGEHNKVLLWEKDRRDRPKVILKGHRAKINSLAFSPDGTSVLSASDDNTAILWDLEGDIIFKFRGHAKAVKNASFTQNGDTIITASSDNTLRYWPTPQLITKWLDDRTRCPVRTISLSEQRNLGLLDD